MVRVKLSDWTTEKKLNQIKEWVLSGLTNEQVAANMGIALSTFYEWCNRSAEFVDAIKTTKDIADIQIENALYKRAKGYTVRLIKQKVTKDGEVITYFDEQHVAPDTTAQIFWLKNRKPSIWRDKVVAEVNGDGMVKDILAYMEKNKNE